MSAKVPATPAELFEGRRGIVLPDEKQAVERMLAQNGIEVTWRRRDLNRWSDGWRTLPEDGHEGGA